MTTLSDITSRVRLELADQAQAFTDTFTGDGTTSIYMLNYYPVDATSVVVKVNNSTVSSAVEERTGRLVLTAAPAAGASIVVTGTHYRYFSDTDLATIVSSAVATHIGTRTDAFGRALSVTTLPAIEVYPVSLLATVQALWALATDAAFDIDISTPDGVSIPRSERFRQLMEMIASREAQYKELASLLGIGLYAIETFTFRRISKATGRYVPVYLPQEVDDYSKPVRVYLPQPQYGSTPAASAKGLFDITLVQGDAYNVTLDFDFDITNYTIKAQARVVPESPVLAAEFTVTKIDAVAGIAKLSLTPAQTLVLPLRCQWDLQVTNNNDATDVRTLLGGMLVAERQVTT